MLVPLMVALWWTAEHDQLDLHRTLGFVALWLVLFRIIWGVAGSSTARFSGFLRGPRTVFAYARDLAAGRTGPAVIGHNPLGGWSVAAMLTLLAADVTLGLFAVDVDGMQPGPFAKWVSFDQGRAIAHWHHWVFNALVVVIGLHLAAILFYAVVKRDNLVGPMVTGSKGVHDDAEPMTLATSSRLVAALGIAAAVTALVMRG
jgi:cytochrome b